MSLFTRSYLVLIVLLFAAFFVSLVIIDNLFEVEDGRVFKAESSAETALALNWLAGHPRREWPKAVRQYRSVLDYDVEVLSSSEFAEQKELPRAQLKESYFSIEPLDDWWHAEAIAGSELYILVSESDLGPTTDEWLELILPFLVLFAALGIGFYMLSRRTGRYLDALSETTTAIGNGEWQQRANTNVPQPIRDLAESVNAMAEQLERTFKDQQIAMGAIPHEIRSPIAKLRFAVDLSRKDQATELSQKNVERIDRYVDELDRTVEATLQLVRGHHLDLSQTESTTANDLLQLTQQTLSQHDSSAVRLEFRVCEDEEVQGHSILLAQAATNLVENALRYATAEVLVTINTSSEGSSIVVEDDGAGIPEASRDDVLSPFFRLDPSRTRGTGGVGLGLAISKNIASRHGGTLMVDESEAGGARFTLHW